MSAAIFVALALGWAVYLIPKALKHHDEVARTRSVDRFSQTMRVLSRRDETESRAVLTPERGARVVVPTDRPSRSRLAAQRRAAAAAARRRRRILTLLLLADVVVGTLAALAILQVWAVAIPVGLTLAYLVLCRVLVKRERRAATPIRVRRRRTASPSIEGDDDETPDVVVRSTPVVEEFSDTEDTAALQISAVAAAAPDGGSLWDPLPVTLPTYVDKAKAPRTVRTIDLSAPGVSSSGHDAEESQLVAASEEAKTATAEELPEQRAVNG